MINVHPFPARMAPELALNALTSLHEGCLVLDPMSGSGTVLQQARSLGLRASGYDLDPLAVLISKVATTHVDDDEISVASARIISQHKSLTDDAAELPWMDGSERTERFIDYWFGVDQKVELRKLSYLLSKSDEFGITEAVANVLRVALSRIIVTKKSAASLAQDTSHSRPHRVLTESDYNVVAGYQKSLLALRRRVGKIAAAGSVTVGEGDARDLKSVANLSVDLVLTSPPYLNAIDYMRGHKMSLVWLGYGIEDLKKKRSISIGAERRPDKLTATNVINEVIASMGETSSLASKYQGMIHRYAIDLQRMLGEVSRVLKVGANATFVMGNSCLKDVYIQNSEGLIVAAKSVGLSVVHQWERDLPSGSRYLPTPTSGALSKRMRKEVIVTLRKA